MRTRRLGQSDLDITVIGFGAWAIGGGDWLFGWGPQDDADSVATIRRAIDLGVNWVDTAAVYGLGHSELVVARALAEIPAGRRPYVFTKSSLVWDQDRKVSHSLRADSIRREVEGSLQRLGVDVIDLYQIHWPRWGSSPEGWDPGSIEEGWQAMADVQKAGKVRYIGASNFAREDLARANAVAPVTSLQPPYSLLRREAEVDLLPWCLEHGTGVIVYSPMQSGLLTGTMTRERLAALPGNDWRRKDPQKYMPALKEAGIRVIHKCTAVRHSIKAEKVGCDAVSVDGFECGGHPGEDDVPNFILLPRAAEELSIPFVASGGMADGRSLVAALSLGAEGMNMGTRFMATVEAPIHQNVKDALVAASELDTRLVMRPLRNTERVLNNAGVEKLLAKEKELGASIKFEDIIEEVAGVYPAIMREGKMDAGAWSCGMVAGLIHDVPTVKELVDRIMSEAEQIIRGRLTGFLDGRYEATRAREAVAA